MNQSNVRWIEAYMDWTDADSWTFGSSWVADDGCGEAGIDAGGELAAAYLHWMDAWQLLCESEPHYHATAFTSYLAAVDDDASGLDELWDAIVVALHADSDRMPFLRQIMDADTTAERTAIPA